MNREISGWDGSKGGRLLETQTVMTQTANEPPDNSHSNQSKKGKEKS
jgi:hypothetical protein